MSSNRKTDNSFLPEKINLRIDCLKNINKKHIKILECFSGNGIIYSVIKKINNRINVTRIEKKNDAYGKYLCGDNIKYLKSLDLNDYDVIDLDAYGIPDKQLKIVLDRGYHGYVIVTHIQSVLRTLPFGIVKEIGITENMFNKCTTMYGKLRTIPIESILRNYGCKKITGYFFNCKNYFYCEI